MTIATYPAVHAYREQAGKCPTCRKRVVRKLDQQMTVSPFNRNPDGTVRTPDEVRAAVEAKADQWVPDFEHFDCATARHGLSPAQVIAVVDRMLGKASARDIRQGLFNEPRSPRNGDLTDGALCARS